MVSYDLIREQFKRFTLAIGILYTINAGFAFLAIIGAFSARTVLNTPELSKQLTAAQLASLETASTPVAQAVIILTFVMTALIAALAFINRQKLRKQGDQAISYIVYYIGIFWAIASVLLEVLMLGGTSMGSIIIMLIFGFLHIFTLHRAQQLKEK